MSEANFLEILYLKNMYLSYFVLNEENVPNNVDKVIMPDKHFIGLTTSESAT